MFRRVTNVVVVVFCLSALSRTAEGATFCVDDASDGAPNPAHCDASCSDGTSNCSLRDAIAAANAAASSDAVDFDSSTFPPGAGTTITLTDSSLSITDTLTIDGPGADTLVVDANGLSTGFRVFTIAPADAGADGFVTFRGLTITGGRPNDATPDGGGIYISVSSGTGSMDVSIEDCAITGNTAPTVLATAGRGGGIFAQSSADYPVYLDIDRSIIDNNHADGTGGGIDYRQIAVGTSLFSTIRNTTVAQNSANGDGGGVHLQLSGPNDIIMNLMTIVENTADADSTGGGAGGGVFFVSTDSRHQDMGANILARNEDDGTGPDCAGTFESTGSNVIGIGDGCTFVAGSAEQMGTASNPLDPGLTVLGYYGGPLRSYALLQTSPALDASMLGCVGDDQRGFDRSSNGWDGDGVGGDDCDVGAVEMPPALVVGTTADTGGTSLRAQIQAANLAPGIDSIVLPANATYGVDSDLEAITDSVVLSGLGSGQSGAASVLDAASGVSLLRFDSLTDDQIFYVSGLAAFDGSVTGAGSDVGANVHLASGDTLYLSSCLITNGQSDAHAAGVYSAGHLFIEGCTLRDNDANPASGNGGALYVVGGTVVVLNSTIRRNSVGGRGAGVFMLGGANATLDVINSTISGNTSGAFGSALEIQVSNTVTVVNSTIAFNDVTGTPGAGLFKGGGTNVTFSNAIVAENSNSAGLANCSGLGAYTSLGSNLTDSLDGSCGMTLVGGDLTNAWPGLEPLAANGALAHPLTHALQYSSDAIDRGDDSVCVDDLLRDQRGLLRFDVPGIGSAQCDIGAFENTCGDGVMQLNELCDDAGDSPTCDRDCTPATCGDGLVNAAAGEACDDGNTTDDGEGTCVADCSALQVCGDGSTDGTEECDDGNLELEACAYGETSCVVCAPDCTSQPGATAFCGDGTIDVGEEECDDSGQSATCDFDCTLAFCGDDETNLQAGELCDNAGNSLTCDADCTGPICGDGFVNPVAGEECDDGMESATCNANCRTSLCGDGIVNTTAGETCDDFVESVTCDDDCSAAECGDGRVNATASEECDDGNATSGDGCSATCENEVPVVCGNGVLQGAEQCDDGNQIDGDGCSATCETEAPQAGCGDGMLDTASGEECDDANLVDGDGCSSACLVENTTPAVCGNGTVEGAEECDDGNGQDGDGCSSSCTQEGGGGGCASLETPSSTGLAVIVLGLLRRRRKLRRRATGLRG